MTDLGETPRWRGINHLALITPDMDATVRFYHGVLGARLVADLANRSFRHYFFEFGAGNTVAFFEYHGVELEPFAKRLTEWEGRLTTDSEAGPLYAVWLRELQQAVYSPHVPKELVTPL